MQMPNLVVTVGVEHGEELFRATVSLEMAGRFLEYLGSQLKPPPLTKAAPPPPSGARKVGEED